MQLVLTIKARDLARIGLQRTVVSDDGKNIVAPTTMTMGMFTGADVGAVRNSFKQRSDGVRCVD
jgi:hypothetical protein